MASSRQQMQTAYQMIKAKRRKEAQDLLFNILRDEEDNVDAWWLLANAVDTPDETREALQMVLQYRPDHDKAQAMLDQLNKRYPPAEPAPPPPPPPSDDDPFAALAGVTEDDPFAPPAQAASAMADDPFAAPPASDDPFADDPFAGPAPAPARPAGPKPLSAARKPQPASSGGKFGTGEIVALVLGALVLLSMFLAGLWSIIGVFILPVAALLVLFGALAAVGVHLLAVFGREPLKPTPLQTAYVSFAAGVAILVFPMLMISPMLNSFRFGVDVGGLLGWLLLVVGGAGLVAKAFLPALGGQLRASESRPLLILLAVVLVVAVIVGFLTGGGVYGGLGLAALSTGVGSINTDFGAPNTDLGGTDFSIDPQSGEVSVNVGGQDFTFNANSTSFGDVQQHGGIGLNESRTAFLNPGEQHGYTFSASAGQTITFDMLAPNGDLDTYLELLDSSGNVLDSDDDGGENLQAHLTHTFASDGTYTIVARSFSSSSSGNYDLRMAGG